MRCFFHGIYKFHYKFLSFHHTQRTTRWWFQICFIFNLTWGDDPIWLIFFKWVETTNQKLNVYFVPILFSWIWSGYVLQILEAPAHFEVTTYVDPVGRLYVIQQRPGMGWKEFVCTLLKISMEPKNMEVWKMMFLFNWVIFRFHVIFSTVYSRPCEPRIIQSRPAILFGRLDFQGIWQCLVSVFFCVLLCFAWNQFWI